MAKATANCVCVTCGEVFVKTETKRNRAEAESWKEWAEAHYDLCGKCYAAKKREEEAATPISCSIRAKAEGVGIVYWVIFSGNTYPVKDELKALGCGWTEYYPGKGLSGLLAPKAPPKRWAGKFTGAELDKIMGRIRAICDNRIALPDDIDFAIAADWINYNKTKGDINGNT